jgi:hypothetical protein
LDEVAPDEELPNYEASTAPAYDSGSFDDPLITYHLRQYDRRIQMLMTYGQHAKSSYRITRNGFRIFSKKSEMEVLYTSHDMCQRNLASIDFDNQGPLPWCPRAHFDHTDVDGTLTRHTMEAKDFTNWAITVGDRHYGWLLSTWPCSLVFKEQGSSITIARFLYSGCGTLAGRGAEIGQLTVYRDGLTMETKGVDQIVCSLMVAITHLKRVGRHYRNVDGEILRAASMTRENQPVHRVSSAGFSMS